MAPAPEETTTMVRVTFNIRIPRTSLASANSLYDDIQKFLKAFAGVVIDMSIGQVREREVLGR